MAAKEPAKAFRRTSKVDLVSITSTAYWGLTLGDLRRLVEAAEELPDYAEVELREVKQHYSLKETMVARTIMVRDAP